MKTTEELNAFKEEVITLNEKLRELTDEELAQVTGGAKAQQDDTHGKRSGQSVILQDSVE